MTRTPSAKNPADETAVHAARVKGGPATVPHLSLYRNEVICVLEAATYYGEGPDARVAQTPGTKCLLVGAERAYIGVSDDTDSPWHGATVVQFEVLFPDGTGGTVSHLALTPARVATEQEVAEFTGKFADKCVAHFKTVFAGAPQQVLDSLRQLAMKARSAAKIHEYLDSVADEALGRRVAGMLGQAKAGVNKRDAYDAALASLNKKDGGLVS